MADAEPNPLVEWYEHWRSATPAAARLVLQTLVGSVLLGLVLPLQAWFANVPYLVLAQFQVWRLVLSPLAQPSLLSLLWLALILPQQLRQLELAVGSVGALTTLAGLALVINGAFVFVCGALAVNPLGPEPAYLLQPAAGFWMVMLCLLVADCERSPAAPMRSLVCPRGIPARYCPWLLFGVSTLLGGFQMDNFCGLGVGYVYAWGSLRWLEPSADVAQRVETGALAWLAAQPGFVSHTQARGFSAVAGDSEEVAAGAGGAGGAAAADVEAPARAFHGSGRALGAASAPSGGGSSVMASVRGSSGDRGAGGARAAAAAAAMRRQAAMAAPGAVAAPRTPSGAADAHARLIQMGYAPRQAAEALKAAGGDMMGALERLGGGS